MWTMRASGPIASKSVVPSISSGSILRHADHIVAHERRMRPGRAQQSLIWRTGIHTARALRRERSTRLVATGTIRHGATRCGATRVVDGRWRWRGRWLSDRCGSRRDHRDGSRRWSGSGRRCRLWRGSRSRSRSGRRLRRWCRSGHADRRRQRLNSRRRLRSRNRCRVGGDKHNRFGRERCGQECRRHGIPTGTGRGEGAEHNE
jgi:hypothetical protein